MDDLKQKTYYKYRSLENFERFLDIVVNNQLYGAVYNTLNDPMEGKFNKEGLNRNDTDNIYRQLKNTRICSLLTKRDDQQFPDDYLMWSHYANSHYGCCIELHHTNQHNPGWKLIKVNYQNDMPRVSGDINEQIETILSVKTKIWEDENEVRAIKICENNKQTPNYHIKIDAVYFGERVTKEKCEFYKKIISGINDKIKIYRIREKKNTTGCFPELTFKEL